MTMFDDEKKHNQETPAETIVRVKHDYYKKGDRYIRETSIRTMKSLSTGCDLLAEEMSSCDVEYALDRIGDLTNLNDGLYKIHFTNFSRDWETGNIDDWKVELIPHQKPLK